MQNSTNALLCIYTMHVIYFCSAWYIYNKTNKTKSTLIGLDLLRIAFSRVNQFETLFLHISSKNNPILIYPDVVVKQLLQRKLKLKPCCHHLLYADVTSFFVTSKCEKSEELTKIAKTDEKNLHIFIRNLNEIFTKNY